jgi:hypothetical protein
LLPPMMDHRKIAAMIGGTYANSKEKRRQMTVWVEGGFA